MKKKILVILILFSVFSLFAEDYEVLTVIGKVSCEKNGKWKSVKVGDKVSDELNFKVEENSSVTFNVNEKRVTLRGPNFNVLSELLKEKNSVKKITVNNSIRRGSIAEASQKATKGVAVAASRASESQGAAILDEE